jgi:hypothetical protein
VSGITKKKREKKKEEEEEEEREGKTFLSNVPFSLHN